jgi:hypothetical protein
MHTFKKRVVGRRSGGRYLSLAKTIYLFRCGDSGLYAFTADRKGRMLPSRMYPRVRWRFERAVTLRLERSLPKRKIVKATLDAVAEHGFHLIHAAVNAELLAFAARHNDPTIIECSELAA